MALVPMLVQLADGWQPTRDDAMISIGSYQVFSAKFPLVGVWSQASQGLPHAFYGLGPLEFWLLAVPVRVDPAHGALWGAALVCAGALSVGVEAAWSARGWPAALAVTLLVADLGWQTELLDRLSWNPFFGLVFLVAALATAWAVAVGRFGWWPLTVFFGSVSAQSHLVYAAPAIGVAAAAPLLGLALGHRPRRWRWLGGGLLVTIACWTAPVVQQAMAHPGNLTVLFGRTGAGSPAGPGFGLHALSFALDPRPIWATGFPYVAAYTDQVSELLRSHSPLWAVAALCFLVVVAAAAWRARRRDLSALAALTLVLSVGVVVSFGEFPENNLGPVGYLATVLWVVGTTTWLVSLWAAAGLVVAVARRWQRRDKASRSARRRTWTTWGLPACGLSVLVAVCITGLRTLVLAAPVQVADKRLDLAMDRAVAAAVVRHVPRGPVVVVVEPATFFVRSNRFGPTLGYYAIDYWGVATMLLERGREPALPPSPYGVATHLTVSADLRWTTAVLRIDPKRLTVTALAPR